MTNLERVVIGAIVFLGLAGFYWALSAKTRELQPPPRSCEALLTGAGTYEDSTIILKDSTCQANKN